ncbi:MAG: DUF5615 family PIN-like protein [Candidatus Firestonebacteria bacterium]
MRFLIDENLPRSIVEKLITCGHDAIDLRTIGKLGISDEEVMFIAQRENRIVITANYKHFANLILFPPQKFPGIVVVKMLQCTITTVINKTISFLCSAAEDTLLNTTVIIEPHRVRRRTF